ncbi:unnamed protein product [Rotaria socialis]|uniref:Uncharacterized protein n=1 Tax=Rotaria socialis TaxID=392032 RepID=A0A818QZ01_9BILA|nr:unnamed protein product [Rotaria socialis]CAF4310609.1 unnamed protein product [Rotaria socialis]
MFALNLVFSIIQLISIINRTKLENVCLDNLVLTCYCEDDTSFVSCTGKTSIKDSFVDWAPFVSANHRQSSFTFYNLTRLTYLTFTNFSSTFHLHGESIDLTFINGMDEIEENAFQSLHEYSDSSIEIKFVSPQNFKLADYAFGRGAYYEVDIDSIQYSHIHKLPYQLNLKSMDGARFYQMNIRNCGDMEFISNGSSTIELIDIAVSNCSLANSSLLIESISTGLAGLDLTSNHLIALPSLKNFQNLRAINLKNNFIEEITVNIFNNMSSLGRLDLSNNRIRNIEPDSFVGLRLTELNLDNNRLTSLETLTTDNQTTSFLYPLNESLTLLVVSNNFLQDLNPLKHMTNLDQVKVCYNQIKTLDGNIFEKAHKLKSVDFSYNQIELIDSMTFNGTIIDNLNLAGNRLSSLETNESLSSNTSLFEKQTSSFLYPISSTISSLSFSNCTNLIEINWFIIIKLQALFYLDLSEVKMTEKSWLYRKTDVNSEDSSINWHYPPGPRIILYGIRLTDNDYCLTKSIVDILNKTILIVDIDHSCNCFIYSYDTEHRPICLYNQSVVDELSRQCTSIDLFCELFSNNSTALTFTEWTSLSSLSTTTQTTSVETIMTLTSSSTLVSTEQSIITSTHVSSERPNKNGQMKIILATVIPSIFVIVLCLVGTYLYRRKKFYSLTEDIEMRNEILQFTDKE